MILFFFLTNRQLNVCLCSACGLQSRRGISNTRRVFYILYRQLPDWMVSSIDLVINGVTLYWHLTVLQLRILLQWNKWVKSIILNSAVSWLQLRHESSNVVPESPFLCKYRDSIMEINGRQSSLLSHLNTQPDIHHHHHHHYQTAM